jgi:hypothetical protein
MGAQKRVALADATANGLIIDGVSYIRMFGSPETANVSPSSIGDTFLRCYRDICTEPAFNTDTASLTLHLSGGTLGALDIILTGASFDPYIWNDPDELPPGFIAVSVSWFPGGIGPVWDEYESCWWITVSTSACNDIFFAGDLDQGIGPGGLPNHWVFVVSSGSCIPGEASVERNNL